MKSCAIFFKATESHGTMHALTADAKIRVFRRCPQVKCKVITFTLKCVTDMSISIYRLMGQEDPLTDEQDSLAKCMSSGWQS